jgi:glycosyltransferase involved in cell wall biosynthesis
MLMDHFHDGTGGGERFAVGLAIALARDGYEVWFCTTRGGSGELLDQMEEAGIRYFSLNRNYRLDLLPLLRLTRFIRRERFDVVHGHMFGSNVWASVLGRLARVPAVVAHEQTWSYEGQPLRRFVDGYVIGRLAHRFVSVSTADQERMIALEHVPERKTLMIPNAYIPRPTPGEGDLRAELGIPADAPLVGTVCQLRPQKRLDVLIDAFTLVAQRNPDAHFVIVGDGEEREDLERRISASGFEDRIQAPGTRTDLETIFRAYDVAVMSSDYEGLPLFACECMGHGVPLVATAVGGLPDLIDNGRTGMLVPRRDPRALGEAILELLDDAPRREAIAAAAKERLADYTIDRVTERFERLYDELLDGRRRQAA